MLHGNQTQTRAHFQAFWCETAFPSKENIFVPEYKSAFSPFYFFAKSQLTGTVLYAYVLKSTGIMEALRHHVHVFMITKNPGDVTLEEMEHNRPTCTSYHTN